MSSDPGSFYRERVPAQWNLTYEAQEEAARTDAGAARLLEAMRTVKATIDVVVRTADGDERFHLNVAAGRMRAGENPEHPPFMTLIHDLETFATLERESGDSVLGFLGAIAGMPDDMKLTSGRIQNLYGLDGSILFDLRADAPIVLTAHFGEGPVPDQPDCTIRIEGDAYAQLRSGALAPQDAFMNGSIEIAGDAQMAMQMALAALSPE